MENVIESYLFPTISYPFCCQLLLRDEIRSFESVYVEDNVMKYNLHDQGYTIMLWSDR